jgi:hypothetical protein
MQVNAIDRQAVHRTFHLADSLEHADDALLDGGS